MMGVLLALKQVIRQCQYLRGESAVISHLHLYLHLYH